MIKVKKIWLTDSAVWIRTEDGKEAKERFVDYPRLRNATEEQRCNFVTDAVGIHWPELDEDLCFDGFFERRTRPSSIGYSLSIPNLTPRQWLVSLAYRKAFSPSTSVG